MKGASRWAYACWLLTPGMAVPSSCFAVEYLTAEQAQRKFFPATALFVKETAPLSEEQRSAIEDLADTDLDDPLPAVSRVLEHGATIGFFIVDNVIGKHEYITYAVALSPSGALTGIEILEYRENHGEEVRDPDWRAQFVGKTSADKLRLGKEIKNLSGATYSCRHITEGIRKLLALHKVIYGGT